MLRNIIRFKGFLKGTSGGFLKPVSFRVQLTRCYRYDNGPSYRRFNNGEYSQKSSFKSILLDKSSRKYLALLFGGCSLFYYTHLDKAPVSDRSRFIWVSRPLELTIGNYTYKSIWRQTQQEILPPQHPLSIKIENIFMKIVEAAYKDPSVDNSLLDGIKWEIHVVNDPTASPNAFVLPGGKVFIFSSILPICANDDGIATVLAHEFAHQLARHTAENLSKAPIYSLLGLVLYTVTGAHAINNILLDGFLRMPASRQMETEADYIGLMIMSRACFQPQESIKVWERMANFEKQMNRGGVVNMEFLSTHPASTRRIENMSKWLPKANEIYEQSDCSSMGNYYKSFFSM
ncbi:ALI_HP2_G0009090.mRNA.1.CDS.1 [Saccharomyces cerevisiae]|nr:ALI_HP2_G0009090.mRNA.1.CDS.1 [Saccharomyces cerevisiae]CAI6426497.1 ALI_HP2_G0009090.mRNA.1.CDS.1 [Saccharomyces cerevisiae]CAI6644525.1 ALI_HP1_G0035270.mRNA.1.CDS.1 [Saccharomyces cerevisiae]CAI6799590.1 ALI_collapsed_G0036450.mRNA.1.CDS.1 [Saccharomyces cerevisiae]